ncbi:MAG TPA: hypothetical protein VFE82_11235 [Ramlibacter sp.]|jgi:hypothetical protein|uniref:hypothetical protein n=1 Tax=Ramlibacter sp. TaxID=1917967 RepID=UPI002D4DF519|nr:hypothetical protein [Ramlibacter sp.]HZY19047.1 hypothetical protein [Ramlibacter sp.]
MRPSSTVELKAVAVQLLAELDAYEPDLDRLMRAADDEALYARNAAQFDAIRAFATCLPSVQVCWVEVLISRFELMEELWRKHEAKAPRTRTVALHAKHRAALRILRDLCARKYAGAGSPGAAH